MRLGNLESLVALYDGLCLVVLDAPPFAATVVAAPGADVDAILALRPAFAAAMRRTSLNWEFLCCDDEFRAALLAPLERAHGRRLVSRVARLRRRLAADGLGPRLVHVSLFEE